MLVRDTTHHEWLMLRSIQLRMRHSVAFATPAERVFFLLIHLKCAFVEHSCVLVYLIREDKTTLLPDWQSIANGTSLEGSLRV